MKINKIVAAAAAASLAVTSLASVASAKNPRTWSLVYNFGILTATPEVLDKSDKPLTTVDQDSRLFSTGQVQGNLAATKGGITEAFNLKGAAGAGVVHDRLGFDATADGNTGAIRNANTDASANNTITHNDFDAVIPVYVYSNTDAVINNKALTAYAGKLTVSVKGRKRDNANFVAIEKKTVLQDNIAKIQSNGNNINIKANGTPYLVDEVMFDANNAPGGAPANAKLAYFPLYVTNAPENMIMPTDFDAVDSITVDASGMDTFTFATYDQDVYFTEVDCINGVLGYTDYLRVVPINPGTDSLCPWDDLYYEKWFYDHTVAHTYNTKATVYFNVPNLYSAANTAYKSAIQLTGDSTKDASGNLIMDGEFVPSALPNDITKGGVVVAPAAADVDANGNIIRIDTPTAAGIGNLLIEKMADLVDGIKVTWKISAAELAETNAWLPVTDVLPTDGTLYRNEIWLLSDTENYNSASHHIQSSGNVANFDQNQTYNVTDYRVGTRPYGFGGLASQVADYFNKELNGTITFTFVDVTTLQGRQWLNGGIPSTEVGLRNVLTGATPDDFALYFNYATTTGSLETVVDIDVDAGEVTFDISNILDALGGYTVGTIHDIYYGMTKGTSIWNNNVGMWVSQVTLRAEDNADVSADATVVEDTTVADDDDDDVTVEDDDDLTIEDDDDVTIEDDDDVTIEDDDVFADDADDAAEIEIVSGDDDDANPHTGVALAVVPALVAAAAMVVSKKRK